MPTSFDTKKARCDHLERGGHLKQEAIEMVVRPPVVNVVRVAGNSKSTTSEILSGLTTPAVRPQLSVTPTRAVTAGMERPANCAPNGAGPRTQASGGTLGGTGEPLGSIQGLRGNTKVYWAVLHARTDAKHH